MKRLLSGLVACALCVACGGSDADTGEALAHPSIDDLPGCNPAVPGFSCLQKLFLPLAEDEWPFDANAVGRAWVPGGVFVLPSAKLTALHVIDAGLPHGPDAGSPPPDCFAGEASFSAPGEVISRPDCADFLLLGGSPISLACQREGITTLECTDRSTVADTYDIGLVAADETRSYLDVSADVEVGEEVFLVGDPMFLFAAGDDTDEVSMWFGGRYPVVSSGKVLVIEGGGMVVSNLAFSGNSGGPLLNRRGQVLGVASTKIGDLRAVGTATDPALANHRTVVARLTEPMVQRIAQEPLPKP